MTQLASDREGRQWALLSVDGVLRARLVHGVAIPAVMDLSDLVDTYGPVVLSPAVGASVGYATFVDTVDLVARDAATASVHQVGQVGAFALGIVKQGRRSVS